MKQLVFEDEPRMLELFHQELTEEGDTVSCGKCSRQSWELQVATSSVYPD